jgi:hypothetical protein
MATEKKAVSHENGCYKNPANKTCVTCSNEVYEREGVYCSRGCKIELINALLNELHEKMVVEGDYVHNVKPIFNCPNYNEAELQPGTGEFLNEIRPKIEMAHMYRELAKGVKSDPNLPF